MEKLHVFVSYSLNYAPIYDRFKRSYDEAGLDSSRLYVYTYDLSDYKKFGFQTDAWYKALREKMLFFAGMVRNLPDDGIAALLDADVQIFPNHAALKEQLDTMVAQDLDLLCMRESDTADVNGGCIFARKTPGALRVVDHGLLMNLTSNLKYGEQTAINDLLRKDTTIKWKHLDADCVVWGNKLPAVLERVFLHHAVVTHGVQDKLKQMDRVRKAVLKHHPILSQVTALPRIGSTNVRSFQVVVCRYKEDVKKMQWAEPYDCVLYDRTEEPLKSTDKKRVVATPNIGRESHAFLTHIVTNYDKLADVTLFSQADPTIGYCVPIHHYRDCASFRAVVVDVAPGFPLCTRDVYKRTGQQRGYGWVQFPSPWKHEWEAGSMLRTDLSMGDFFDNLVERERPEGACVQCLHGMFSVTREVVHGRPKRFYQKLLDAIPEHSNPEIGHYFERAWPYIFRTHEDLTGRHPVMIRGERWHGVTDDDSLLIKLGM